MAYGVGSSVVSFASLLKEPFFKGFDLILDLFRSRNFRVLFLGVTISLSSFIFLLLNFIDRTPSINFEDTDFSIQLPACSDIYSVDIDITEKFVDLKAYQNFGEAFQKNQCESPKYYTSSEPLAVSLDSQIERYFPGGDDYYEDEITIHEDLFFDCSEINESQYNCVSVIENTSSNASFRNSGIVPDSIRYTGVTFSARFEKKRHSISYGRPIFAFHLRISEHRRFNMELKGSVTISLPRGYTVDTEFHDFDTHFVGGLELIQMPISYFERTRNVSQRGDISYKRVVLKNINVIEYKEILFLITSILLGAGITLIVEYFIETR